MQYTSNAAMELLAGRNYLPIKTKQQSRDPELTGTYPGPSDGHIVKRGTPVPERSSSSEIFLLIRNIFLPQFEMLLAFVFKTISDHSMVCMKFRPS